MDDAYTIHADPPETLLHLVIYGELFAPDFDAFLAGVGIRTISVDTRLEFVKYCVPDFACECADPELSISDPRRAVKAVGPYAPSETHHRYRGDNHNLALTWVIRSTRWKPHWKSLRAMAGPDFQDDFDDQWWYDAADDQDWRQRMWECVMICQGFGTLQMLRPHLRQSWVPTITQWRDQIRRLPREPVTVMVGRQATLQYPYLLGDLRICVSGYVAGT